MRRTRTTTMLLLGAAGVAVTAVSGCVSVGPDRPPGQSQRAGSTAAPGNGQNVRPQVVQAPAREALELAGPSSPPAAPPSGRTAAAAPRPYEPERDRVPRQAPRSAP
ncbi:hypothetical protein L1885_18145, partial [Streptomyces fuscigenes]|nr:hypothetical protein [Streptomyces fuscigenes]